MAGFILFASLSVEGKRHDKRIADEMYSFPYEYILQQDTGYQGYSPDNVTVIQPTKKPKGKNSPGSGNRLMQKYPANASRSSTPSEEPKFFGL